MPQIDETVARRLAIGYATLLLPLAATIALAWDSADWHRTQLIGLLTATALLLDALARRFDKSDGTRFTAGALMPVLLTAVLVGPVPAALVGGISGLSDSLLLGCRPATHLKNTIAWMAVGLAAGVVADQWIVPRDGVGEAALVFALYLAADAVDMLWCIAHAHVLGAADWRTELGDWLRAGPGNVCAALIVAATAYGYRAGGVGVLAVMSVGLVSCQFLLLRIERVEGTLRAERDRHTSYLRMVGTMVVTIDPGGSVAFLNARARAALGDIEGVKWEAVDAGGREFAWTSTRLPDGALLLSGEDVTARRDAERHVEFLAYNDRLTGLPNRTAYDEELPVALAVVDDCGVAAGLFLLDIDNFKRVNDEHGHDAGDALLVEAAARLRAIAGPDELLVRRGGDEFVLLAPDLGVAAGDALGARRSAARIADRIVGAFTAPFPIAPGGLTISVSVATALYPLDASSAIELDRAIEAALYGLKQRTLSHIS